MHGLRRTFLRRAGLTVAFLLLLAAAAGTGFLAAHAAEQDYDDRELARKVVLERELTMSTAGKKAKVTLLELEYAPGGSSEPHRHAGPVVVYVLSGALELAIDDEPPKVYKAGETFFEPAGVLHSVSKNASKTEPARFLAFILSPSDARELTTPAK